jgi:hypothetical protein
MKKTILQLFLLIQSLGLVNAQNFNDLHYYPYHETNLKYCNLALKVELQEVFLNGGMCGHKVFKVKEVLKGEYPYSYVTIFMCNLTTTLDYVKEIIILSNGEMKEKTTYIHGCWSGKDSITTAAITGLFCVSDTNAIKVPDPKKNSPLDFLQFLKSSIFTCAIVNYQERLLDWVKDEHVKKLVQLLDSKEPAIPVYESYNTDCKQYTSTVGIEALFLLEGYRQGVYPPDRCSLGPYTIKQSEHLNNVEQRKKDIIAWLKSTGKYPVK